MPARLTWQVVRYAGPTPDEDPDYRGRGVIAVPGDVIRVSTPDGDLEGEPVDPLLYGASHFWLMADDGLFSVSRSAISCIEPWLD
jgi:hypothetical protein